MNTPDTVDVSGIPLFAKDIPNAVDHILAALQVENNSAPRCISATGAHGLVFAQKNAAFRECLQSFYINLPDGKPSVWVGRAKGAKSMQRCYGPDFFAALMRATATDGSTRHFLCGGQTGVAEKLQTVCGTKFGNHQVVGHHCPPFRPLTPKEFQQLGAEIDQCDANIVWIGISTPKQEMFAAELAQYTQAAFIITVGAAFDFHTDRVIQAPGWMQQAGLEWFFRLMMEPRRLYRRYLEIVPAFIFYNLRDMLLSRR
jgi:N-acetylglucosaminyldiphosphoundecaprenol N-acetyl-beta-D-mannosaminyltransferase